MKHLWTPKDGPMPKRKGKPHEDPMANVPEWLTFLGRIMSGKMKPQEAIGFHITPDLKKTTGTDQPWRVARDRLRRQLREAGLQADFRVRMWQPEPETNPEYHFIAVSYEPPIEAARKHG